MIDEIVLRVALTAAYALACGFHLVRLWRDGGLVDRVGSVLHALMCAGMSEEALATPGMRLVLEGLQRSLPGEVPAQARLDRAQMLRHLMVHVVAERERALAEGVVTPRGSWDDAATGLVDAITGLLLAPVTG